MKLSSTICFSIISSLAATKVSGLVLPNFKDIPESIANSQELVSTTDDISVHSKIPIINDAKINELNESNDDSINSLDIQFNEYSIPNSFIIILKDNISDEAFEFHKLWVSDAQVQSFAKLNIEETNEFENSVQSLNFGSKTGGIGHVYDSPGFRGYSGLFTPEVANLLRHSNDVASIELDSIVKTVEAKTQEGAPWGLSRISHRKTLGLSDYNKYLYDNDGGEGVTAYVIDTGVNIEHEQFGGRAVWGATIPTGDTDTDGNGHGTHCAGTIGSKDYGVSKKAKIVAVKVLKSNGSGTMSDVVKGVEFAANAHVKEAKESPKGFKGSTANMSLGGGKSPALDLAVNAAVKAGLHFAVAAGNDDADACNYSPAAAEGAVTVGASTLSDTRAYFSNWGKCVDIFAPGLNILSTYIGSNSATAILSGTSMASPHVCGLLTYFLSLTPSSDSMFSTAEITPKQLKQNLIKYGTKDVLSSISDETPNILIYNGAGGDISDFWNYEGENESEEADLERSIEIANDYAKSQLSKDVQHIADEIAEVVDAVKHAIAI